MHWITALTVFAADQATKYAIVKFIPLGDHVDLLPFANFVHTQNRGAAFGMFHNTSPQFRLVFFGAVTLICLYLLLYWLGTTPQSEKMQRFALSLILGGALGNLLDRSLYGQVTDFIHVFYHDYHYPAFNVADSAITIGVALLFLRLIRQKQSQGPSRR